MISFSKLYKVDAPFTVSQKKSGIGEEEFMYGGGSRGGYSEPTKIMTKELDYPTMNSMYQLNTWIRACVDKIVRRSTSVSPIIKAVIKKAGAKPTDDQKRRIEFIENLLAVPNNSQESFDKIRTEIFTDVLIFDAGALELVSNNTKKGIDEIFSVAGNTIRKNVDQRGIFKDKLAAYIQKDNYGKTIAKFAIDELCYFSQYPRANRVYGNSPLESLRQTVTAELFATDFNLKRFVNDATPRIAIMFENLGYGQGGPAMTRLRQWWDQELKGNPHRPILIGSEKGGIKIEKVGLTNEDMQFQEYSRWLLSKIMAVYHMQAAVLGVIEMNQGRINAEYQEEQFKKDAIKPLLKSFSNQFNTLVIWSNSNFGYNDIYMSWEGIDNIDKQLEAKIHQIYLRYGVFTINMVLQQLGMEPVEWGDVPYLLNQMIPLQSKSKPSFPARKEDDDFDLKGWLSTGLTVGGIIPTGLERVEKTDIDLAIRKLLSDAKKKKIILV